MIFEVLLILAFSAVILLLAYGVILGCNAEMKEARGDVDVFYVSRIGLATAQIHFVVLAIPVLMAATSAIDNIINKHSQLILVTNFKKIVTTIIALCVVGALVQAIVTFIINVQDSQE